MKLRCHTLIPLLALVPLLAAGQTNTSSTDVSPAPTTNALTLEQSFERALQSNEEAKLADLAVKESALLPWRSLSVVFPQVQANASRMYPEEEITGETGNAVVADPTDRASIRLSQSLFNSDALASYRSSRYLNYAALDDRVFRLRDLLFRVADTYISYLKLQQIVGISRETLKLAQEQRHTALARFDAGQVPKTDLLRAEVEVSRTERELEIAQNAQRLGRTQLCLLIGADDQPFTAQTPAEMTGASFDDEATLEKLIRTATEQRDDLKRAVNQRDAARWVLRGARMTYLPKFSVDLEQTWADPASLTQPESFWTATLRANLPLFEGGSRRLDIKQAGYRLEQAELVCSQLVKTVRLQVTEAWLRSKTAKALLESNRKELDLAVENYDVVSKRYEAGQATSLDLIDAFTQLSRARISVANLTFDYQVSLLNLLKQIGSFGESYVADKKQEPK